MNKFSFPKEERIRKSRDFQALKKDGSVFKTRKLIFNYSKKDGLCKLGVIVTKKVGPSVIRNKVKRWLRELFRTNKSGFAIPLNLVIIPRSSELSFDELQRDFLYFSRWYNEKSADCCH